MDLFETIKIAAQATRQVRETTSLSVRPVKANSNSELSMLRDPFSPPRCYKARRIATRIIETERLGEFPLWEGYREKGATRAPRAVSTTRGLGRFYAWLVRMVFPAVVVEFGAAFGVSGMYWLSGLEENKKGRLLSFEVNREWAEIARRNMAAIGGRFHLTVGMFKDHIESVLKDDKIDIACIDAIHTSEFVLRQLAIVKKHLRPGGFVLLDDVDFSADMESCWRKVSMADDVRSSAVIGGHLGIIET